MRSILALILPACCMALLLILNGCANIIPPTGGARDSIPPVLVNASPADSARNVRPQRITLTFNEYIDQLQNANENVIISPTLPNMPTIDSRLRTINIRFRDTLEPNTTYSINFGNAIRDVNEGNVLKDFTYVFSTGNTIDDYELTGRVLLAETGRTDSTMLAVLHQDLADTAIIKKRPRYYTRLDGSGMFTFRNLPAGQFAVYAISRDAFNMQYTDSTLLFAFLNQPVTVGDSTPVVQLYAFQEAKRQSPPSGGGTRTQDRRLRYSNAEGPVKDVLSPLNLDFVRKLGHFDSTRFQLTDTNFAPLPGFRVMLDSNYTRVSVQYSWALNTSYALIIDREAVADVDGLTMPKTDTLRFTTKRAEDYGDVRIRFTNLDLSRNPVLQIVQTEVVVQSFRMTTREMRQRLFKPGDYDLRILYDRNNNGVWDPGNFREKKQPEVVQTISRKLGVRANWENEVDITL